MLRTNERIEDLFSSFNLFYLTFEVQVLFMLLVIQKGHGNEQVSYVYKEEKKEEEKNKNRIVGMS